MSGAQKIGELSLKLASAAMVARERGDDVHSLFFALKAAECLQLAKALGWSPEELPNPPTRSSNAADSGVSRGTQGRPDLRSDDTGEIGPPTTENMGSHLGGQA